MERSKKPTKEEWDLCYEIAIQKGAVFDNDEDLCDPQAKLGEDIKLDLMFRSVVSGNLQLRRIRNMKKVRINCPAVIKLKKMGVGESVLNDLPCSKQIRLFENTFGISPEVLDTTEE